MRKLAVSTILALLLAGCAGVDGAPENPTADAENQQVEPAPIAEKLGGIQGLVTDDEQRPAPNVTIVIQDTGDQAQTDALGAFSFQGLAAGDYGLEFVGERYEPGSKLVTVQAGRIADVLMVVVLLPTYEPWVQTWENSGTFNSAIPGVRVSGSQELGASAIQRWQTKDLFGSMQGILFEVVWVDNGPFSDGVSGDIMPLNEFDNPDSFLCSFASATPPIECDGSQNITRFLDNMEGAGSVCSANQTNCWHEYRMGTITDPVAAGTGASIRVEMSYTFYASHFFRQSIPDDYQLRP